MNERRRVSVIVGRCGRRMAHSTTIWYAFAVVPAIGQQPTESPGEYPAVVWDNVAQGDLQLDRVSGCSFAIRIPVESSPADDGSKTKACRVEGSSGRWAMDVAFSYTAAPRFRPSPRAHRTINYDEYGNLIVWRPSSKSAYIGGEVNSAVTLEWLLHVRSDGYVIDENLSTRFVTHYPGWSREGFVEMYQFSMASGRGYAQYLTDMEESRELDDGRIEFTGPGHHYMPFLKSYWRVIVDPAARHLVRFAECYGIERRGEPILRVETEGMIEKEGLAFAERGVLTYVRESGARDYNLHITILDVRVAPDLNFISRIEREVMATVSDDAPIQAYDLRDRPPPGTILDAQSESDHFRPKGAGEGGTHPER